MDGFRQIVAMLEKEGISCELIVDGSYLTEEIQPDDIDFAVVVTPDFLRPLHKTATGTAGLDSRQQRDRQDPSVRLLLMRQLQGRGF